MKLTNEQIKSVTFGAIRIEETENGLHFQRCTQKQIDAWFTIAEVLGDRAQKTTGVRLDFYTNSKELRFTPGRDGKYEILINNLLRQRFRVGKEVPACEEIAVPLCDSLGDPLEEARVTLCLPSHTTGIIQSVELDDGAYIRVPEFDCNLLMIGDSITQGWDSTYDTFTYAYILSRALNANSINQGIGGAVFHEDTVDEIPFDPDIVTIAYGTNDYSKCKTFEEFSGHLTKFLDGIQNMYASKKVFVISPIWRGNVQSALGDFAKLRSMIAQEAEKRGMIHINGLDMVPPIPELFADEWLHPNALGFGFFGENVTREILKHLK